jgi:hypothetical protein
MLMGKKKVKKLKNQGNPADNVRSITLTDKEKSEQERLPKPPLPATLNIHLRLTAISLLEEKFCSTLK